VIFWLRFSGISKLQNITGGLPRVAELFEGRKPKNVAVVSELTVSLNSEKLQRKGALKVKIVDPDTKMEKEYTVPLGRHLVVYEGDKVEAGEALSDGAVNPHDIS
jgi:DNA-directed RNA polymerase subunit beta'